MSIESEGERFASTSKLILDTYEVMNDSAITRELGQERVGRFKNIIENSLYIPSIENGQVVKPASIVNPNAIPIVSLFPDEKVSVDSSVLGFMPHQEQALRNYLNEQKVDSETTSILIEETLYEQYLHNITPWGFTPEFNAIAFPQLARSFLLDDFTPQFKGRTYVYGRPSLFFKVGDEKRDDATIIAIHELTHIDQYLNSPFMIGFKSRKPKKEVREYQKIQLERELEAYHVQQLAVRALFFNKNLPQYYMNLNLPDNTSFQVNAIREEHNKDILETQPYKGSLQLHADIIRATGHSIVGGLSAKRATKEAEKAQRNNS